MHVKKKKHIKSAGDLAAFTIIIIITTVVFTKHFFQRTQSA